MSDMASKSLNKEKKIRKKIKYPMKNDIGSRTKVDETVHFSDGACCCVSFHVEPAREVAARSCLKARCILLHAAACPYWLAATATKRPTDLVVSCLSMLPPTGKASPHACVAALAISTVDFPLPPLLAQISKQKKRAKITLVATRVCGKSTLCKPAHIHTDPSML